MNVPPSSALVVNVVELNPHAPRPFVFSEAALCLRDAIRAAGFRSEVCINRADVNALSIVIGALPQLPHGVEQMDRRKTAIFNFEQLGSTSAIATAQYRRWLRDWLVFDYHAANIEVLKRDNGPAQQAFEVPIVPSHSIALPGGDPSTKTVDVLFYGTLNQRRARILAELEAAGLKVERVDGAYGPELTPAIRRARLVLSVHFYEAALFPVARILQPVAQGVPVVCEDSIFSARSDWSRSGIRFAAYDKLVPACLELLRSPAEQAARARSAQGFARGLDFEQPFRLALGAMLRRLATLPAVATPSELYACEAEEGLSVAEIEALLQREASELPPESHLQPPRLSLVERQLGHGRLGRLAAWLLLGFSVLMVWQTIR